MILPIIFICLFVFFLSILAANSDDAVIQLFGVILFLTAIVIIPIGCFANWDDFDQSFEPETIDMCLEYDTCQNCYKRFNQDDNILDKLIESGKCEPVLKGVNINPKSEPIKKVYSDDVWVEEKRSLTDESCKKASSKANEFMPWIATSKKGLVGQLKYNGFTTEEAECGVNLNDFDWNDQAKRCGKSYLRSGTFSQKTLASQLKHEGFTPDQIEYAITELWRGQ